MPSATITCSIDEWQEQITKRQAAENHAADLERQLAEAKLADPAGRVPALVKGMRAAHEVIRIAIAFAPPELVPTPWPHEALVDFANELAKLPDAGINDRDAAIDMIDFAKSCARTNNIRAERARRTANGEIDTKPPHEIDNGPTSVA